MKHISFVSLNSCLNYLVSCTYIRRKKGLVKSKNKAVEKKTAVFDIMICCFNTHLTATFTICSKRDSKDAGVSLN